eukprot:SM000011S19034  [mRNA]  locus=s11:516919:519348:+ [translate_table: standard]
MAQSFRVRGAVLARRDCTFADAADYLAAFLARADAALLEAAGVRAHLATMAAAMRAVASGGDTGSCGAAMPLAEASQEPPVASTASKSKSKKRAERADPPAVPQETGKKRRGQELEAAAASGPEGREGHGMEGLPTTAEVKVKRKKRPKGEEEKGLPEGLPGPKTAGSTPAPMTVKVEEEEQKRSIAEEGRTEAKRLRSGPTQAEAHALGVPVSTAQARAAGLERRPCQTQAALQEEEQPSPRIIQSSARESSCKEQKCSCPERSAGPDPEAGRASSSHWVSTAHFMGVKRHRLACRQNHASLDIVYTTEALSDEPRHRWQWQLDGPDHKEEEHGKARRANSGWREGRKKFRSSSSSSSPSGGSESSEASTTPLPPPSAATVTSSGASAKTRPDWESQQGRYTGNRLSVHLILPQFQL